jgi:hypothetical protein
MVFAKLFASAALIVAAFTALAAGAAVPAAADNDNDPECPTHVEAVFWTGADWPRLGQALADDRGPCTDYWVSIPPAAADKTALRFLQDDVIRAMGIHPVAEMTLLEGTGWANWVRTNNKTWFEAGVEFRRRMAVAGYDVTAGETYLINEFDQTTMRDADRTDGLPIPPFRRSDMRDLMEGLYYGLPGMPTSAGVAEFGIAYRHQDIPFVEQYKAELQDFLSDGPFWEDVDRYIRWLAVESYGDTRLWGVPDSPRAQRRLHLQDYIFHVIELARSGGESSATSYDVLHRKFLPLLNAGYRARGGDQFQWRTGHGNTIVDEETMKHFVSEQIYAVDDRGRFDDAPEGRLGFSWQPCDRPSADVDPCRTPLTAPFSEILDRITDRIAESIQYSFRQDGAGPFGGCRPGPPVDWCDGRREDAEFTDAWSHFRWED